MAPTAASGARITILTAADPNLPTYGVLNQIQVGLGQQPAYGQAVWNSAMNAFPAGMDKTAAIDSFRNQFGLGQLFSHPVGTVFYPSNTFAAPFQPVRNIYLRDLLAGQRSAGALHRRRPHFPDEDEPRARQPPYPGAHWLISGMSISATSRGAGILPAAAPARPHPT